MRPEPFPNEDSDDTRTVVQDSGLLYGGKRNDLGGFSPRRSSSPAGDRDSLLPGTILAGKYRVEQVVERSAFDVLLIARHIDLGEPVVLRHLTPEGAASPEIVASFQRGAREALKLKGFHVERVADLGRLESGVPYRVSELPRGPSLEEFVRVRGALPSEDAVDLVLLACEGVAEAHASGQIHRNLSTPNIVLERHPDGAPLVKVRGFGLPDPLAFDPDLSGRFGRQFGRSPNALRYAAPEQVREPESVDQRADIWALGAILYELLSGVPVYAAKTTSGLLAMIVADPPAPLESYGVDVDPNLDAVVMRCLSKDPAERPSSISELVDALAPFGSEQIYGIATRVSRVLAPSPVSRRPFPSSAPIRRSIPALPERTSGPYYGNGYYTASPGHDVRRRASSAVRTTTRSASQRHHEYRSAFAEAEPSSPRSHTLLLLLAGAAFGGAIAFIAGSGWRIERTSTATLSSASPVATQIVSALPPATAATAVASVSPPPATPVMPRERRPASESVEGTKAVRQPASAEKADMAPEPAPNEQGQPLLNADEQALFDKPE